MDKAEGLIAGIDKTAKKIETMKNETVSGN
jgi:hypothetical protein